MLTLPRELLDDIRTSLSWNPTHTNLLASPEQTNDGGHLPGRFCTRLLKSTVWRQPSNSSLQYLQTGQATSWRRTETSFMQLHPEASFFFDARSYTYDIRQKFKAKLKSAMIRTALKEFTFVFSECDSIALDLMTDGMRYSKHRCA